MTAEPKARREEMPKAYNPGAVEGSIYRRWEEKGYFTAQIRHGEEPYTIVMPPPNLTGELHLGHAMMDTVEDILIRWRRMQGRPTLWLPGVDHAALPVHALIEKQLAAEGLSRQDIGREAFLERTWAFVERNRARIFEQHKRLGISADWTRERFTMDPGLVKAVRTIFVDLYEKGLIYRGNRLINWCPNCQSAISDLEVDHEEEASFLWHVRYPLIDAQDRETGDFITIATTRPETIVADTAIAVHPDDPRYREIRAAGLRAGLPIIGRALPIVPDEAIDMEFGTGALKVTPGHDQTDFEIGERHGLPVVNAINPDGTMNDEAGPYAGMDRFVARQAIVADLKERGYLVKEEAYTHSVGHCSRCGTVVEPLMSEQWFVAMNQVYGTGRDGKERSLAGDAMLAVLTGWVGPDGTKKQIKMVPERFTKVYIDWLENIHDWCISRQIWWGHRIPVWYCDVCENMTVAVDDPARCQQCGSDPLRQDEDTLDTWFSSALWPFSTLGWPDDTEDLRYFYPTTVMETGYEIIFLWVARMIMTGLYAMDDIPFEWVYFHGTVRDDLGRKMSKSLGNGVDPLMLIDKYGADALRFKLMTAGGTGNDQRVEEPRIEAARNFANKLWNASRFVLGHLEPGQRVEALDPGQRVSLPAEDRWILSRLERVVADTDRLMERFELGEAGRGVQEFVWDEFCDWYVEMAKIRLREQGTGPSTRLRAGNTEHGSDPRAVLVHVLDTALRLLHPYMPYVTEEIWSGAGDLRSHLPKYEGESIMVAAYPRAAGAWRDEEAERALVRLREIVSTIRDLKKQSNIAAGRVVQAYVVPPDLSILRSDHATSDAIREWQAIAPHIGQLSRSDVLFRYEQPYLLDPGETVNPLTSSDWFLPRSDVTQAVAPDGSTIYLQAAGLDATGQIERLEKQRDQAQAEVGRLEAQLANERFTSNAPAAVVAEARERLEAARARLGGVEARLAELG